jgi:phospholipid/cholesterol/gamma-HCH transport system substrate-binding protein
MDLHYKQEVTVGALVLVGVGLFVAGTMWLGGSGLGRSPNVSVSFPDAGTLKRGSPVKVSGVTLGNVADITYQGYGKVLVRLDLDEQIAPRKDATATLATIGLVADAVVRFNPGSSTEPLPEGAVITGTVERGLMDMGGELGGSAKDVLEGLRAIEFKQLSENLNKTLLAFQRISAVYSDTRSGPLSLLPETMRGLQQVSARVDSVLGAAQLDRTSRTADSLLATLTALSVDAKSTLGQIDQMLARINRGEGSLGKLASDTLLYQNAQKLLKSIQEFVDDVKKNPGKIGLTVRIF